MTTYYLRDKNGLLDDSQGVYTSATAVAEDALKQDLKLREDVHITDENGNRVAELVVTTVENDVAKTGSMLARAHIDERGLTCQPTFIADLEREREENAHRQSAEQEQPQAAPALEERAKSPTEALRESIAREAQLYGLQQTRDAISRTFNLDGKHQHEPAAAQELPSAKNRQAAVFESSEPMAPKPVAVPFDAKALRQQIVADAQHYRQANALENIGKNFQLGDPPHPEDEQPSQRDQQQEQTRREAYGLNTYTLTSYNDDGLKKTESFSDHAKGLILLMREKDERATLTDQDGNRVAWKEWEGDHLKTKSDQVRVQANLDKSYAALSDYAKDAGIKLGQDEIPKGGFRAWLNEKHPEAKQQERSQETSAKLETVLQQGHRHQHQFRG